MKCIRSSKEVKFLEGNETSIRLDNFLRKGRWEISGVLK